MANLFSQTHDAETDPMMVAGNETDWSETVWNIDRDETPFLNSFSRGKTKSIEHKWMVEKLNDSSAKISDGQVQGFTPTVTETLRYEVVNYVMTLQKAAFVADDQEQQLKHGISSELNHQVMQHMPVLKRSMELRGLAGVAMRKPKSNTKAGVASGIPGLVGRYGDEVLHFDGATQVYGTNNTVNVEKGEEDFEGTSNGFVKFKDRVEGLYKLGSHPTKCVCSPTDKKYVSGWNTSGNTTFQSKVSEVNEMIDVVKTDFDSNVFFYASDQLSKYADTGTLDGTTGAMVTDFAILYDPKYLKLLMFKDFYTRDLGRTQDGTTRYAAVKFTYECVPHSIAVFNFSASSPASPTVGLPTTAAGYTAAY